MIEVRNGRGEIEEISTIDELLALVMPAVKTFTPTIAASAHVDGDVLFNPTEIANFFPEAGARLNLLSVSLKDKDGVNLPFDLLFFKSSATLGTLSSAADVSAADYLTAAIGQPVQIAAQSYSTIKTGLSNGGRSGLGIGLQGTGTSLWVGAIARGNGTFTNTDALSFELACA